MQSWFGIDFGTTNSVVTEVFASGSARAALPGGPDGASFRSVLCFWPDPRNPAAPTAHAAGAAAIDHYLADPLDSRLMMSLKTYLAQASFSQTQIFGRPHGLEELVAIFLRAVLATAGVPPGARIVAGRPVRFAGEFADDALGEQRLRAAFARAGHPDIAVALEPRAAGYRFTSTLDRPAVVLIGDFGGGTSDFSVLRFDRGAARPLAHTGVGVAGDMFDYRIIDRVISPRLGKGGHYTPGNTPLPIPPDFYSSFARWHALSQMRAPRTLRDIAAVARMAEHPEQLHHLLALIEDEAGYGLYRAVDAAKRALSTSPQTVLRFDHNDLHVAARIDRADFEHWIAPELRAIGTAIDAAISEAGLRRAEIDRVFLTGGSSFVPAVRALFSDRFGNDRIFGGGEFVSVAEGLALLGRDGVV